MAWNSLIWGTSLIIILYLSIRAAWTDIHFHKAYNRDVIFGGISALVIQIVYFVINGTSGLVSFLLNAFIVSIIAIGLYTTKVWAAGDTKLFSVLIFLIPQNMYATETSGLFPALFPLCLIFTAAMVYVVAESVYLFWKECSGSRPAPLRVNWKAYLSRSSLLSLALGLLLIETCDSILYVVGLDIFLQNRFLIAFFNMSLVLTAFSLVKKTRSRMILLATCSIARIILGILYLGRIQITLFTVPMVICLVAIRDFANRYNYRSIPTDQVHAGLVLSQATIFQFVRSRVRGLPAQTDETTRCRLTSEEAEAIKRWGQSKYGLPEITVVRHIPFAPFIGLGIDVYLALSIYLDITTGIGG